MKWEKVRLGDCCIKIGSGATPKGGSTVYVNEGTSFIRSQNVYNLTFDYDGLAHITDEAANKLRNVSVKSGDVLINITGDSVARTCIVPDSVLPARVNQHVAIIRPEPGILDYRYLNYYLVSPNMQAHMLGLSVGKGASRNAMTKEMIENYRIPCPPLDVQRRISEILLVYDDLIENNRKQIKLLEEAAQRLYRAWFVELRFPGHEHVRVVDGVPEGWKKGCIENVCDTIGGGTPSTKIKEYYEGGSIPWVTPTDITRNNSLILLDTQTKITEAGLQNSSAKMVPPGTILMTSRASVGYFGICGFPVCTNQGFISCVPYNENMQMYLLYNLMNRVEEIRGKAGGSTYLEISKKVFRGLEILIPDKHVISDFQKLIIQLVNQMRCCTKRIIMLQEARDRLLPKLMNGEIEA